MSQKDDEKPPEQFSLYSHPPVPPSGTSQQRQNGERTSNRGPCPCGYKHWCDGEEYDYIFTVDNISFGHNAGDNCQTTATRVVAKYKSGFGNTALVSDLAAHIRRTLYAAGKAVEETPPEQPEQKYVEEKPEIYRPTKNTTIQKDGKFVKTVYPGGEWDKIKTTSEENKETEEADQHNAAANKSIKAKKEEREKIKQKLALDEKEREKDIQKNKTLNKPVTKKGDAQSSYIVDGVITKVTKEELSHKKGELTIAERVIGLGDLEDEKPAPRQAPTIPVVYPPPDITVHTLHKGHVYAKAQKDGEEETIRWLTSLGISPENQYFIFLQIAEAEAAGMFRKPSKQSQDDPWAGTPICLGQTDLSAPQPQDPQAPDAQVETPQGPPYEENYKIVVDNSQPKVVLKITLPNKKSLEVVLNTETHTLTNLYNHIRNVTGLTNFHLFDITPPKPVKLEKWDGTMREIGLTRNTRLNLEI